MKTIFLILLLNTTFIYSQWIQDSIGMGNVTVRSFAYSGNNIYAGTDAGVYISANNGNNWTQTSLNFQQILAMVAIGNNIFAGCNNANGVYLSTNNGINWSQTALNNRLVYSLAANGNNIFAGTHTYGVYFSLNNGINWTQTSLNNQYIYSLAINGNNIFAGCGNYNGVYLSTNNGINWVQTSLNNEYIDALALNGNNIFAGTAYNGVYLSTNNGTSWAQTSLSNQQVYSLAINGNNVFAGTGNSYGIYVSTNNGTSWTQRNEGFGNILYINSLFIINNFIFAGTYQKGVYRRPLNELIGINPISNEIPTQFFLSQNYPNPFNPSTKIRFALPRSSFATLVIYNALGRELETLVNEQLNAGTFEVNWSTDKFASGVYYYMFSTDNYSETKKMILIK